MKQPRDMKRPLGSFRQTVFALCLCGTAIGSGQAEEKHLLREISGILVSDGGVFVVGDDHPGQVLRLSTDVLPEPGKTRMIGPFEAGTRIPFRSEKWTRDLEGIALLNGRLVIASEMESVISTPDHSLVDYGKVEWLTGKKNRGIEGLAIRPANGQTSLVAVLAEFGGAGKSKTPSIGVHRMIDEPPDASLTLRSLQEFPVELAGLREAAGIGEKVGLRGTALLWYRWPGTDPRPDAAEPVDPDAPALTWKPNGPWGFLVLISEASFKRRKWLLRTDARGRVRNIGVAFVALSDLLEDPKQIRHNWEGLAWLDPGSQAALVLAADNGATKETEEMTPTPIAVIELPKDWLPKK